MNDKIKTKIEQYEAYYDSLLEKHPDTMYSLNPAEREEEMKNAPVLGIEELKVFLARPLPENAGPEYVELHKQSIAFLNETLIPNEEFLKRLEAGEFDNLGNAEEDEDYDEDMDSPFPIRKEDDCEWIR